MPLSICIPVKNRSKVPVEDGYLFLLPNNIKAISNYHSPKEIEVIIVDFNSTDWPLEEWIDDFKGELDVKVIKQEGPFSAGKGRNEAAYHAKHDTLLFLDADCLINAHAIDHGIKEVKKGYVLFPYINYLDKKGKITEGANLSNGSGICFISKDDLANTGEWPEFYSWGGEDDVFFNNMFLPNKKRYLLKGIKHQWHPSEISHKEYINPTGSDYNSYVKYRSYTKNDVRQIRGNLTFKRKLEELKEKHSKIIKKETIEEDNRSDESVLVVSKFAKTKIEKVDSFDNVIRCDYYLLQGYEDLIGSKTTHNFRSSKRDNVSSILLKPDPEVDNIGMLTLPISMFQYITNTISKNSSRRVTSEFIIINWLLLFYKTVNLAGHFDQNNKELHPTTYYGAEYKNERLECEKELKFLETQNKNKNIILL